MVVDGGEGTGERIRTIRTALGLSQIQLAALLGVSNVTVNRWENGKSAPGEATLQRVEALTGSFHRPSGLPIPTTPFVGRTADLVRLPSLVRDERLVTLLGPPGSGKTRLAIEVASRSAGVFRDGATFVDLSPLPPGSDVVSRVGDALGLEDGGTTPMSDRLAGALADRSLLLILDNCEHVAVSCRALLERLPRDCGGLRVLATSQVPLGLAEETRWNVPPLAVPSREAGPESIAGSDAVALFVLRARHQQRDFVLSPLVAPIVADICRRLDGLPLAIELAAARVAMLSPAQIAQRLDDRFSLLRSDDPAMPPRRRALLAALDWSHGLLDDRQRRLFRRLAVFGGSFELDAAEAICGDEDLSPPLILDLLSGLMEHALVLRDGAATPSPAVRYRLLETQREYATAALVAAEEDTAVRLRHARYFLHRVREAVSRFGGPDQAEATGALEDDADNTHTALAWAIASRQAEIALALTAAVWRFWHNRGWYLEGVGWLERALAVAGPAAETDRAEAIYGLARLRMRLGRYPEAEEAGGLCRAAFLAIGDRVGEAKALDLLGLVAQRRADYRRSRGLHEAALALNRATGDRRGLVRSLIALGQLANLDQDYPAAERLYAEAWTIVRALGDLEQEAVVINDLGDTAARRGNGRQAVGYYERSLAISRELDQPEGIAAKVVNLAEAHLLLGNDPTAKPLAAEGVERYRRLGNREHLADALYIHGLVLTTAGDHGEAVPVLQEALGIFDGVGNVASAAQTLELLAGVAARLGEMRLAAGWLGAAEAMRRRVGASPYPPSGYDGIVRMTRLALGETQYEAVFAEGAGRAESQVLVEALHFVPPPEYQTIRAVAMTLTGRQREILRLIAQGMSNREVGRKLGISVRTVERHLTAIYTVVGADRRAGAVAVALTAGLLDHRPGST